MGTPIADRLEDARTIYVLWSDDGQHIRKWDWTEFDLAERLNVKTIEVSDLVTAYKLAEEYKRGHADGVKTADARLRDKNDEIAYLQTALSRARGEA